MSFKDYEYKRPNIEELKEKFTVALEKFDNAKTVEEQKQVIHSINEIRNDFGTMGNLCYIRHSVDTTDTFIRRSRISLMNSLQLYKDMVQNIIRHSLILHFVKN